MEERDCEAAEGCVNTAQGECFRCKRPMCSLHAPFDAHGCDLLIREQAAVDLGELFARLERDAERTMRGDTYPCELCRDPGEYLCVRCDRFLCGPHYGGHICSQKNFAFGAS